MSNLTHDDLAELTPADETDLLEALQFVGKAMAEVQKAQHALARSTKRLVKAAVRLEQVVKVREGE